MRNTVAGRKRICVVTAGHLSTCPRMLKAADAFMHAGYDVRVVSSRYMKWPWQADLEVRRTRSWEWSVINYDRENARSKHLYSGVRLHSAQTAVRVIGAANCSVTIAAMAYSRIHNELVRSILSEPSDLIYGGTSGALAAVASAATHSGIPYALDLEDWHSAQHANDSEGRLFNRLAERIECAVLPKATFLTAGSAAIASVYRNKLGVDVIPLHNTFPLPATAPNLRPTPGDGLRLYWFGQTIGPGRGLETVVCAMGMAKVPGELHLRGNPVPTFVQRLRLIAAETAPNLSIIVHKPAPPDTMVELCQTYDAGLATEPGVTPNNEVALSNKALTYILAGLGLAISDTPGQCALARDLGEAAIAYHPGDIQTLADGLKRWAKDKTLLARAKAAAWEAGKRRWHWEHPQERGALLDAASRVFQA